MTTKIRKLTPVGVDGNGQMARNIRYNHEEIAETLKNDPGEWYLVLPGVSTAYANHIKTGAIKAYQPAGSFEAVVRDTTRNPSFSGDVYAKYVGKPRRKRQARPKAA